MPRVVFSANQASDRVPVSERFPIDPGEWNSGEAARYANHLRESAHFWLQYRKGTKHVTYRRGAVFPRTRPVPPVSADAEAKDVPPGDPYYDGRPARPEIGSEEHIDAVYEEAATLGKRLEKEYQLRFVRMLGWGGLGAVALFDTRFKPDPLRDDTTYSFFAIKFPLKRGEKEDRSFRREKKYMAVNLLPSFPTSARAPALIHKADASPEIQTVSPHRPDHRAARRQGQGQSAKAPPAAYRKAPTEQQVKSSKIADEAIQESHGRGSRRKTGCRSSPSKIADEAIQENRVSGSRPSPSTQGS